MGRWMAFDNNGRRTIDANLKKARKCWIRLAKLLRSENLVPRVAGMFYKAVVMAILLYSSESWVVNPSTLKRLEGFHMRAAWTLARVNTPQQKSDRTWEYPDGDAVLEEVGLRSIESYIEKRWNTIAEFVATRPILEFCRGAGRKRGSQPHCLWWEHPMDLDAEEADGTAVG